MVMVMVMKKLPCNGLLSNVIYPIYVYDDPELTLTHFKTMSNLAKLVFVLTIGPYIRLAFTGPLVLWFFNRVQLYTFVIWKDVPLMAYNYHFNNKILVPLIKGFEPNSGRRVVSLSKIYSPPKVLVIPWKLWLRPNMTENLFAGTLSIKPNQTKTCN